MYTQMKVTLEQIGIPNTQAGKGLFFPAIIAILFFSFTACSDPASDMQDGEIVSLLVANEGNFADANGSITSFDPETQNVVQNKFEQVNGRPLAGIIQDMVIDGDRLYVVLNSINKIEVLDSVSLESIATIEVDGFSPSGFIPVSESKGYVGSLFGSSVYTVDLENHEVTNLEIPTGNNPNGMVVVGSYVFVANNGFGEDHTVSVIDIETDELVSTITTGNGPIDLAVDSQNRVWVVSNGLKAFDEDWNRNPDEDKPGRIDILDGIGAEHIATVETGGFPLAIALSEPVGTAWVVNESAVQRIDMASLELLEESFIDSRFNGVGYSGVENRFYLARSRGYEQSGQAVIYDLEGAAVDSFQVGVAPMKFQFLVE